MFIKNRIDHINKNGWDYDNRIAYGICINTWNIQGLEDLVLVKKEFLDYSI